MKGLTLVIIISNEVHVHSLIEIEKSAKEEKSKKYCW